MPKTVSHACFLACVLIACLLAHSFVCLFVGAFEVWRVLTLFCLVGGCQHVGETSIVIVEVPFLFEYAALEHTRPQCEGLTS